MFSPRTIYELEGCWPMPPPRHPHLTRHICPLFPPPRLLPVLVSDAGKEECRKYLLHFSVSLSQLEAKARETLLAPFSSFVTVVAIAAIANVSVVIDLARTL